MKFAMFFLGEYVASADLRADRAVFFGGWPARGCRRSVVPLKTLFFVGLFILIRAPCRARDTTNSWIRMEADAAAGAAECGGDGGAVGHRSIG